MKRLIIILLTLFSFTVNAGTIQVKNIMDSGLPNDMMRLYAPARQATKIGDKMYLLETGNKNLLSNSSWQASSCASGWTLGTGVTAADSTTRPSGYSKGCVLSFTSLNGVIASQDYAPSGSEKFPSANFDATTTLQTASSNVQVCGRKNGSTFATCATVTPDSTFRTAGSILGVSPTDTSVGVSIITTSSTTGSVILGGESYVGITRQVGTGVPPNTFSAKISNTGVITDQVPNAWLSSCTNTSGSFGCVPLAGNFTAAPTCLATPATSGGAGYSVGYVVASSTATSLVFGTTSGGTPTTLIGFTVSCTKATADSVQSAITPNLMPQYWSGYMIGTGWTSTSTSGYVDMAAGTGISITTKQSRNMTCTAASGSLPGITCTPNVSGLYWASVSGPATSSAGASVFTRLYESASATTVNDGNYGDVVANSSLPFSLPGLFIATANQPFTLKVQAYASSGTTTIKAASASYPLSFTVMQVSGGVTAPWLLGSVTSDGNNPYRIASVNVRGAGTNGTCSSSPCTLGATDGFASVTRTGTGAYTATLTTAYTQEASCHVEPLGNTSSSTAPLIYINNGGAGIFASMGISCFNTSFAPSDCSFTISCKGPR